MGRQVPVLAAKSAARQRSSEMLLLLAMMTAQPAAALAWQLAQAAMTAAAMAPAELGTRAEAVLVLRARQGRDQAHMVEASKVTAVTGAACSAVVACRSGCQQSCRAGSSSQAVMAPKQVPWVHCHQLPSVV
jgi:hypothetical protein